MDTSFCFIVSRLYRIVAPCYHIRMREQEFVQRIHEAGGKAYIAGGWPRDRLREKTPQDKDYVVSGLTEETFCGLFPDAFKAGNAFPVYRMRIDGVYCDVAFARSEVKTGHGYRGFSVLFAPETAIRDDLLRRDTTINSMAISLQTGALIDPHGGARDIAGGIIRATSEHFLDDPVRALRAARQAAQFGFRIEAGTLAMMRACRDEIRAEPKERLFKELALALASEKPSVFFAALSSAGILDAAYPQVAALIGKVQPEAYHPEGDAFTHTMMALDRAAAMTNRTEVRFAVLAHDLGKGTTPKEILPHHFGHEERGLEALREWNRQVTLPRLWLACANFAVREHMRACTIARTGKIVDLIVRLSHHSIGFDGFAVVMQADGGYVPPFLENYKPFLDAIRSVDGRNAPPDLKGPQIGVWVREQQVRAVADVVNDMSLQTG